MSFGSTSLPPPTADELERWKSIRIIGICTACDSVLATGEIQVHHILSGGGLRLGHRYTVGLCEHCHAQVKFRSFKKHYPDEYLLTKQDNAIGWPCIELPKARARSPARSRCTTDRALPRRY